MATSRTFQSMLNEWLNYDLLREELVKRDYLLQKVEKDNGWKGGTLPVPFKGAYASSVRFGALTANTDVSEDEYVRGEVSTQPEVWGTMKFNHRDLMEHNGKVKEQSFLKLLPNALEDFMDNFKNCVSINLLSGSHMATLTGNGAVGGTCAIDRPERFSIGMKCQIDDDDSAAADIYVTAININTKTLTVSATRGGAALDISAYTTAQNAKIYADGAQASSMTSLRSSLLSLANGGTTNLYGKSKLAYPFLQAINIDGSSVTAVNLHAELFDAYTDIKNLGKGNPDTAIMSYKNLGTLMKLIEHFNNAATATANIGKGAYNVVPGSMKASLYGWTEIDIVGVRGTLRVVGVQECDDDVIMFIDWRALKFHSNNFFTKRTNPDGRQFYEVRDTTGYYYLVDICLFGDLILSRPSYCGIMHTISY